MMIKHAAIAGVLGDDSARVTVAPKKAVVLNLEDAAAEARKDAARFSLYRGLMSIDRDPFVRINGLDIRDCHALVDTGAGLCTVDGKTVDIPFSDMKRILALVKACEVYHGDL